MHYLAHKTGAANKEPALPELAKVFEITPSLNLRDGYQLVLKGFLSPGWSGRLAAALARHRIDIVRGNAEKVTTSAWHSTFFLKGSELSSDPLALDYVALADGGASGHTPAAIHLRAFKMEPCSRHQGSLYLEIRGQDRLGFLGDLLDYFSMRCLFPVRMSVETLGDTALDRFWLRGVGGSVPSDAIVDALKLNLEAMVTGKG